MKRKIEIGRKFPLKRGGYCEIVAKVNDRRYVVKMSESGALLERSISVIYKGAIIDPYMPNVLGVGYIGEGRHKPTLFNIDGKDYINPLYTLWFNMLTRCYSKHKSVRKCYHGVRVCKRWHNFQNFCNDVALIPGFDEWIKGGNYELDKDKKQRTSKRKMYSPLTCSFIPQTHNRKH